MLELQVQLWSAWLRATTATRERLARASGDRDRGEVTSTTALIVILVIAAIAAGGIIAAKITDNANNVPAPSP
jgi:hypothetical protein